MNALSRLWRRLRRWTSHPAEYSDLADEMAFHREMVERDFVARGLSAGEARDAARRAMGNETFMREEARGVWTWQWLDALRQDARYTLRSLRASPGFTIAVVLTLALGLGANATMFSLVDRLFFRPPPTLIDPATAHRVYLFKMNDGVERQTGGQYLVYTNLTRWTTSFSTTAAVERRDLAVGTGDDTREMPVGIVSATFFEFFDAPPLFGRYFTAGEDTPPIGAPVVVLSHGMWRARFGARRNVLGERLQIGSVVYTIIGVAPPEFVGLWPERPPVVFIPVTSYGAMHGNSHWATSYGHAIGIDLIVRRKTGVSLAAATADLTSAFRRSFQALLDAIPDGGGRSLSLAEFRPRAVAASILSERGPEPSNVARVAFWLSGVAIIVLIIACANVANLLLARTFRRRREMAVRVALGVSRTRLVAQLLVESMLLAVGGGAAGLAIAEVGSALLQATFVAGAAKPPVFTDLRTALFAAAITTCAGLFAGVGPALRAGSGDLTVALKAGAREGTYQRSRLRAGLLLAQGALSVVLLVGAGLFVRSLRHVQQVGLGYDVDPIAVVGLEMRGVKLDSAARGALNARLLEAARSLPGIERASLQQTVPFEGISSWPLYVAGVDSVDRLGEFDLNGVSPEYFATMGTRILHGRGFESTDGARSRRVMIVGESMAATLWPGKDPLGQCVRRGADTAPCTWVVGVAENIHTHSLSDEARYYFYYVPIDQAPPDYVGLFVRTHGRASGFLEPLRRRLQRELPGASYVTVTPFADVIGAEMRSWSIGAAAFTAFGILALLVAALGLYSVVAYSVAQRTHELGVRMALGARPADVVGLVVGEGLRLGLASVALGAAISLLGARWVAPMLFNESPHDPAVFAGVAAVLIAAATIASWIPARRAASVDPRTALQAG